MSNPYDEAKRLRIQDGSLVDRFSQVGRDPSLGMPCLVARTTALSSYPTNAQCFYVCSPIAILGVEVEGGSGTITLGSSAFFALNMGTAVPPVGTSLMVTFVDSRWVFRYDG